MSDKGEVLNMSAISNMGPNEQRQTAKPLMSVPNAKIICMNAL